jgi:hypothetical protein
MCCVDKVMMLEADVMLGTLKGGPGDLIPVMAHPPDNTSDLSLDGFLTEVVTSTQKGRRCGIKLDFKTVEVLAPSFTVLQRHQHQVTTHCTPSNKSWGTPSNKSCVPQDLFEVTTHCTPSNKSWGTQQRICLRRLATNRKVAGSRPDDVNELFFQFTKYFQLHYGPGVYSNSNRN